MTIVPCGFGDRGILSILMAGLLAFAATGACAQSTGDRELPPKLTDTANRSTGPDFDLISAGLEYVASPQGGNFLPEYLKLGGADKLGGYTMLSAMIRFSSAGPLRIVVYGALAGTDFIDLYDVVDSARPNRSIASIVEEFNVSSIPVMAGLEYSPVREQFTTYVGASAGIAYSNVEWTSAIRAQPATGFNRPATNIRESGFHPAYRIYAGIDYRFDRNLWNRSPIRGIFLEGSYLGIPIRRSYFAAIRGSGRELPDVPDVDDATLNIGGITFTIGLNLQFVRR